MASENVFRHRYFPTRNPFRRPSRSATWFLRSHPATPATHELPEDEESQIANAFQTVRNILRRAGGSPANIAKVTVFVRDRSIRPKVNPYWLEMFPDEDDRPVRHMVPADMPPGRHIQLEFIAVLD